MIWPSEILKKAFLHIFCQTIILLPFFEFSLVIVEWIIFILIWYVHSGRLFYLIMLFYVLLSFWVTVFKFIVLVCLFEFQSFRVLLFFRRILCLQYLFQIMLFPKCGVLMLFYFSCRIYRYLLFLKYWFVWPI